MFYVCIRLKKMNPSAMESIGPYIKYFEELDELGKGSFATVYKCRHRLDGMVYAIKRANEAFSSRAHFESKLREVFVMATLPLDPHIVRYHDAWIEGNILFLRLEYCEGGSLAEQIGT